MPGALDPKTQTNNLRPEWNSTSTDQSRYKLNVEEKRRWQNSRKEGLRSLQQIAEENEVARYVKKLEEKEARRLEKERQLKDWSCRARDELKKVKQDNHNIEESFESMEHPSVNQIVNDVKVKMDAVELQLKNQSDSNNPIERDQEVKSSEQKKDASLQTNFCVTNDEIIDITSKKNQTVAKKVRQLTSPPSTTLIECKDESTSEKQESSKIGVEKIHQLTKQYSSVTDACEVDNNDKKADQPFQHHKIACFTAAKQVTIDEQHDEKNLCIKVRNTVIDINESESKKSMKEEARKLTMRRFQSTQIDPSLCRISFRIGKKEDWNM